MIKKVLVGSVITAVAFAVTPVFAVSGGNHQTFVLPEQANANSDVIFLGNSVDPVSGKAVQGYAILHPKNEHAKGGIPGPPGSGSGGSGGGSTCYAFLAKGANWKTVEPWVLNPANSSGLSSDFVSSNIVKDIQKWEDKAGTDILGDGTVTSNTLTADENSPDGLNEVYFADIDSPGTIAVTIVWGVFNGPPQSRQLVEWDQVYDDVSFDWSSSGEAGKMDFENIATHELGHAVGMAHPDSTCTEETMYAYADYGETKKQTLNDGDIAGIKKLY